MNINIQEPTSADSLVVEGIIENGMPPVVILTHSLNFFSQLNPSSLEQSFVHQAQVRVSDSARGVTLKEFAVDTTGGLLYYFYSLDPTLGSNFQGYPGGTFYLDILVDGKTYHASTTIPWTGIRLDSLYWEKVVPSSGIPDSNWAVLFGQFSDPAEIGDYARYFTSTDGRPFLAPLNSVADDEFTNGTTFNISLDAGVDKNQKLNFKTSGLFRIGDTVTVKFCDIDLQTYNFWKTWEYSFNSQGNPFSSPIRILGNIPGAYGYWGGYLARYRTLVLQ